LLYVTSATQEISALLKAMPSEPVLESSGMRKQFLLPGW